MLYQKYIQYKKSLQTRTHFSRMRTVRCSSRLLGGCVCPGVYAQGVVCIPCTEPDTPPPPADGNDCASFCSWGTLMTVPFFCTTPKLCVGIQHIQSKFMLCISLKDNTCDKRKDRIIVSYFFSAIGQIQFQTRMHSSRMRTGRSLTVCRGGVCSGGGCVFSGGGGVGVVSQHALRQTPPCEQNHTHE